MVRASMLPVDGILVKDGIGNGGCLQLDCQKIVFLVPAREVNSLLLAERCFRAIAAMT